MLLAASACAALALVASPAAEAHHPAATQLELGPEQLEEALGGPAEPTSEDLYEVEVPGPDVLTHGPDLQLAASSASQIGFRVGDPERPPICSDGFRQHVLYARISGATDRFAASVQLIRAAMRRANAVLNQDSLASGGPTADYRMACDSSGEIAVDSFEAPDASFASVITAAKTAGFNDNDTDYTVFFDDSNGGACGIGTYYNDDRLGVDNYNNRGGSYGVSYRACWFNETPMHENAHNQGAVQYAAPQSTGTGGHCWEEIDVMCYSPDGGDLHQQGTVTNCTERSYFDCGYDTYFDSAPEPGEYLATHWNLGSPLNRFIAFDGNASTAPDPEIPAPGPVSEPDPEPEVDPPDPDPGVGPQRGRVLRLVNNHRKTARSQAVGGWREFRIEVPRRSKLLKVNLRSVACSAGDCNLDLYLRRGARPSLRSFDCARSRSGSQERCKISTPRKGRWFVGVYTSEAETATNFSVRAKHAADRKHRRR